jgi:hypothetical protein
VPSLTSGLWRAQITRVIGIVMIDGPQLQDRANVTVFQDTVSNIAAWLDQDAASRGQDQ